jgi:hypothetical protein
MSFNTAGLTAYVDENKFPLLMQLQAKSGLADKVRKQPKIKDTARLHYITTDATFQSDGCSYNASGTTTLTQKSITVGAIALMEDLCVKDLNGFWAQELVAQGASGEESVPAEIEKAWMTKKLNLVANKLAKADFQGDTGSGDANLNKYDGLLKLIDADATVVQGNSGGLLVAPTVSNIIAVLQAMWNAIPEDLETDAPDSGKQLYLWLPRTYYKMYIQALINANLYNYTAKDGDTKLFGTDVILVPTVGLAGTDRMVLTYADNIVIGMDGDTEEDNMKIWYSEDDRVHKSLIAFKRGVQFEFGSYIVTFKLGVS